LPETYLEKAQKAEEAGLKSTSPEMREGWLEVARSYRLLANRNAPRPSSNSSAGSKPDGKGR
jgi:hypothetical protein